MITTDPSINSSRESHAPFLSISEQCLEQLQEAERELGAFIKANENIYGLTAAREAADLWISNVEAAYRSTSNGHPNWRNITIMTASQQYKKVHSPVQEALTEVNRELGQE